MRNKAVLSQTQKCLAVLADGPATTSEVCTETGIPVKVASAMLSNLCRDGKAVRRPFKQYRNDGETYSNVTIWALPKYDTTPAPMRPLPRLARSILAAKRSKVLQQDVAKRYTGTLPKKAIPVEIETTSPPPARGDVMHDLHRQFDALFGVAAGNNKRADPVEGGE